MFASYRRTMYLHTAAASRRLNQIPFGRWRSEMPEGGREGAEAVIGGGENATEGGGGDRFLTGQTE